MRRPGFLSGSAISKPKHSFGNLGYPPIDIQKLTKTCYPQNIAPVRKLAGQIDSALSTASSSIGYTPEIQGLRNKLYAHLEQHSHGGCGCTNPSDRQMCEGILRAARGIHIPAPAPPPLPPPPPPLPTTPPPGGIPDTYADEREYSAQQALFQPEPGAPPRLLKIAIIGGAALLGGIVLFKLLR